MEERCWYAWKDIVLVKGKEQQTGEGRRNT